MRPSEWIEMNDEEKAFIMAAIDIKVENDKKQQKKAERQGRKGKSKR